MIKLHRRKDIQACGEYRTKVQILEVCDALAQAFDTGEPHQTLLEPPQDPSVAHAESTRPNWAKGEG